MPAVIALGISTIFVECRHIRNSCVPAANIADDWSKQTQHKSTFKPNSSELNINDKAFEILCRTAPMMQTVVPDLSAVLAQPTRGTRAARCWLTR